MDPDMGSAGGAASAGTAMGAAGAAAAALSDRGVRATGREAGSAAGRGPVSEGSWFEHPGVAAVKRDRGLGL